MVLAAGAICFICSCAAMPLTGHPMTVGWKNLLKNDLSNCTFKPGSWTMANGVLTRKGGGDIWTNEKYGDFVLDLEFKVAKETNSGVFFRTADIKKRLHTGIEMQIYDSYGREKPGKHDCGAIYDVKEPSTNAVKPASQWNRVTVTAKGSKIKIVMNSNEIIDIDLNDWPEPHKNPDGTKNKFNIAYKDMAREGVFGFQDHGKPVWYRNIKIKRLD
jgi:hypothetical protein